VPLGRLGNELALVMLLIETVLPLLIPLLRELRLLVEALETEELLLELLEGHCSP
jgi:hypothetical protein